MAEIAPDTPGQGINYIIKIKITNTQDWKKQDAIYAIGFKGDSFGLMDLKNVVDDKNGAFCLTFKVCDSDTPAWQECLDEMGVKPPLGSPHMMTDRPYAFSEIARVGYERGIFKDEQGLKDLNRKTVPSKSSSKPPKKKATRPEDDEDVRTKIINEAGRDATRFTNQASSIQPSGSGLGQGLEQLTSYRHIVPPVGATEQTTDGSVQIDDHVQDDVDKIIASRENEVLVERANTAESRASASELEVKQLKYKLVMIETQLKSSMQDKVSFMAGSDLANVSLKTVNADTAGAVVEALKPQLSVLSGMKAKLDEFVGMKEKLEQLSSGLGELAKAADVGKQLSDHSAGMVRSFGQLSHGMESNSQILRDGLNKTNNALEAFGFVVDEEPFDVPESVKYIVEMTQRGTQALGTPTRDEAEGASDVETKVCSFVSSGVPLQFVCKCGCGREPEGIQDQSYGNCADVVDQTGHYTYSGEYSYENTPEASHAYGGSQDASFQNAPVKTSFKRKRSQWGGKSRKKLDVESSEPNVQVSHNGKGSPADGFGAFSVPKSRNGSFVPGIQHPNFLLQPTIAPQGGPSHGGGQGQAGGPSHVGGPSQYSGPGRAVGPRHPQGQVQHGGSAQTAGPRYSLGTGPTVLGGPRHPGGQGYSNVSFGGPRHPGGQGPRIGARMTGPRFGAQDHGPRPSPRVGPSTGSGVQPRQKVPVWENFPNGFVSQNAGRSDRNSGF